MVRTKWLWLVLPISFLAFSLLEVWRWGWAVSAFFFGLFITAIGFGPTYLMFRFERYLVRRERERLQAEGRAAGWTSEALSSGNAP
jgi:hypothetical protein